MNLEFVKPPDLLSRSGLEMNACPTVLPSLRGRREIKRLTTRAEKDRAAHLIGNDERTALEDLRMNYVKCSSVAVRGPMGKEDPSVLFEHNAVYTAMHPCQSQHPLPALHILALRACSPSMMLRPRRL
jgi:hypothetical protein